MLRLSDLRTLPFPAKLRADKLRTLPFSTLSRIAMSLAFSIDADDDNASALEYIFTIMKECKP